MEAEDFGKSDEDYILNYQPISTLKRKKVCKAVSFGTQIVDSSNTQTPKFESMMKNILDKINFFDKADIIPLPEKPTKINASSNKSEACLKNQPKKEGLEKSPKTLKPSKKTNKTHLKLEKGNSQRVKPNK